MEVGRPGVRLRVHFAPVGYQIQRLVVPAVAMRADVVILFTISRTDKVREALEKVTGHLKARGIRYHVIECFIWDSAVVTSEVGTIVGAAPQHEYFFNASTGTRPASIGGTIAAMFWPVQLYYVPVDEDAQEVEGRDDYPVSGEPVLIPTFETPTLDRSTVETLEFVVNRPAPLSKKELMDHMKSVGTVKPRGQAQVTPQAYHAQADVILHKLDSWGFVDITGRGKGLRIQATPMGRAGSKMFHHILNPRPAPEVLLTNSEPIHALGPAPIASNSAHGASRNHSGQASNRPRSGASSRRAKH